ncbi:acylphosphatase-2 isoform X1 [Cherax quadricarinatus]|uniref:acylphosphatase-2 isoform X1 n=1 Tax=Cherax quadricarinatus TaxID=27406 RepID=UPI00237846D0|nr:acylphosphatase-2-like isoform X1 [Cherax quadricarinatus]
MAAATLLAVDFEVFGLVQGVFFRKYTQKRAKELNLRGWCMNTDRGTVVGQMEGQSDMVSIMKDWLKKTGSPSSRIDKVEFKNEREIQDYTFKNFSIKH